MEHRMYADIIIDISHEQLDRTFQYAVPDKLEDVIEVGSTVYVPFGKGNTRRMGYVISLSNTPSYPVEKIKFIDSVMDCRITVAGNMIKLAAWLRKSYGSTMSQALKTVIPVKDKVKHIEKKAVCLKVSRQEAKDCLRDTLKRAKAQARLLEALLEEPVIDMEIVRTKLNISYQTVKALEDKGIVRVDSQEYYRNPVHDSPLFNRKVILNDAQQAAADCIINNMRCGIQKTYLIHGVTGSGKTEVYMEVIDAVLKQGKQVIMLIPEIALTFQTVQRFYHRFGDQVSIINSRMSKGERYDQFRRALSGEISIMIGPRSALFTQFPNLGLIVIDEEHDGAYRSEQSPKYHARQTAIHIAGEAGASVILGSATPSIESYYYAQNGIYELITLEQRAGQGKLPTVYIADMREELKKGNRSIFSGRLQELIEDKLSKREQMMLFLNKRGMSGFISCRSCGYVMKCPHCDVSLTAHKNGRLMCHYCGYEQPDVSVCPECGSKYISGFRAGTEAVETAVHKLFPNARTLRMDMDTTRGKQDYENILSAFANEQADILIGTQMIVKGHDFPKVTLMGIIAADISLYASDIFAAEKTFQLVTQAAGRVGRADLRGEVVIQTYSPDHYAVLSAARQDYKAFYEREISYRKLLSYPPVSNMAAIHIFSADEVKLCRAAESVNHYIEQFCSENNVVKIGPANAAIYKISDIYHKVIYARCQEYDKLTTIMEKIQAYIIGNADFKNINIQFDLN